jgi:hypothetical protein
LAIGRGIATSVLAWPERRKLAVLVRHLPATDEDCRSAPLERTAVELVMATVMELTPVSTTGTIRGSCLVIVGDHCRPRRRLPTRRPGRSIVAMLAARHARTDLAGAT